MRMKVSGRQTVPRAETLAVLQVLLLANGDWPLKIVTDALYMIKRVQAAKQESVLRRQKRRRLEGSLQEDGRTQSKADVAKDQESPDGH